MLNNPNAIATAADYADAMIVARRAKSWLFVILLFILVAQLAIFFVAKYTNGTIPNPAPASGDSTTEPVVAASSAAQTSPLAGALEYLIGITDFFGMTLVVVLGVVLLLIVTIMLVGRLIGLGNLTSAFIWCVLLTVLMFPWQAFLNFPHLSDAPFRLPGVLYTWAELVRDAHFDDRPTPEVILKWARFVGFPLVALVILLAIQVKSNRGLKLALGEAETPSSSDEISGRA